MTKTKRGLGRGLDALLEPSAPPVRTLSLGELVPNRYQPRSDFDDAGLEELAESIRSQGLVQPIVVTPGSEGKFTIVAGERRWRAARRAGLL
ncbi:MAG: ParB N-terminal domain-containing protein [Thermoanaerobaculia bacterium]